MPTGVLMSISLGQCTNGALVHSPRQPQVQTCCCWFWFLCTANSVLSEIEQLNKLGLPQADSLRGALSRTQGD